MQNTDFEKKLNEIANLEEVIEIEVNEYKDGSGSFLAYWDSPTSKKIFYFDIDGKLIRESKTELLINIDDLDKMNEK